LKPGFPYIPKAEFGRFRGTRIAVLLKQTDHRDIELAQAVFIRHTPAASLKYVHARPRLKLALGLVSAARVSGSH
jgi:hypothetical protein